MIAYTIMHATGTFAAACMRMIIGMYECVLQFVYGLCIAVCIRLSSVGLCTAVCVKLVIGYVFYNLYKDDHKYEGQSVSSDNGSISQKILLESELFVMQNVDMGVAYSCLKYDVFITIRFDGMRIC